MKIEVNNVTKRYADHLALNQVSLQVPEHSVYGLLGPNGAGKTTLIRILNQITAPDTGTVLIDGEPLCQRHIERIGYLPEERGLYKKMKVGEQAVYLAQLKGISKAEAEKQLKEWFHRFEITDWWNKTVEELSKGMQQKVQFIATVLHKPSLLILDEPFSGFDPLNAQIIKQEILRLKENGTTIILSTHNMESVEEFCDNIALIYKSKNILNGNLSDIKQSYANNRYKIVFSGYYDKLLTTLTPSIKILSHEVEGNTTTVNIEVLQDIPTNEVLQFMMKSGNVLSFRPIIPSMNEIFIQVVQQQNQE